MVLILVFVILAVITVLFRFFGLRLYKHNLAIELALKEKKIAEQEAIRLRDLSDLDNSPDELVAIISAAAAIVLSKHIVVRQIKFLRNANDSAWSRMGRMTVMSSHQVK